MTVRILHGDCIEQLRTLADESVHSVCTDPPYEIGFMGRAWDNSGIANSVELWRECLRVLKPGGHLLSFGGSRTYHRMACAIEDAGFEIRDQIQWVYASGFPKSLDVSKAIDKRPGVERHSEFAADLREAMAAKGYTNTFDVAEKVIGRRTGAVANWQKYQWPEAKWWPALRDLLGLSEDKWGAVIAEAERAKTGERAANLLAVAPGQQNDRSATTLDETAPATESARQWQGWGTALKPAHEPIVVARKPLIGTVAANVLKHGTGALNIDGTRIPSGESYAYPNGPQGNTFTVGAGPDGTRTDAVESHSAGRWPANLIHDGSDEVLAGFPESKSAGTYLDIDNAAPGGNGMWSWGKNPSNSYAGDSGSAARFFYTAKSSGDDRNVGSHSEDERNHHPTVKPTDLMQYLVRLVTPPGGTVLDPFAGSGSTGLAADREGFDAILIEREAEYVEIARRRIVGDCPLFAEIAA